MTRGVLTLLAVVALSTAPALADPADVPADVFLATQGDNQYLARDLLLFAKVRNADGQIIGDVEDLILNTDNQVEGVVMGTGGFIGLGEKRVAVRLGALHIKNEDGKVTVSLPQATKEVLDALPPFNRTKPPKSLLDRAIERAKELSAKSSVTAKDAYEKAKPTLEKAGEAAEKAYEKAKEEVAPALEKAKDVAKGAYKGARDALEEKPETAPEATTPEGTTAPEASTPAEPTTETPSP
jgi:sporulation protein YlmC with PRC-barrel domain/vacuolar-type H+-ATPase subunit H